MDTSLASLSAFALLGLGFVFGLKHATDVDHVVAVSTIVSKERNIFRSAIIGGLWGVGHTTALVVVGLIVLVLRVAVPTRISNWLEFCVALMIIGLGLAALIRASLGRSNVHIHKHTHLNVSHLHVHFHEHGREHATGLGTEDGNIGAHSVWAPFRGRPNTTHETNAPIHSHAISRISFKPLLVGAMHGLAGSAALTLLVLTQIQSVALGLGYLAIFGLGSIVGMLLMSGLIGLPFALSSRRFSGVNYGLQTSAGVLSVAFGLCYAYEIVITSGF